MVKMVVIGILVFILLQSASFPLQESRDPHDEKVKTEPIDCPPCNCVLHSKHEIFADCDGKLNTSFIPLTVPDKTYNLSLRENNFQNITRAMFRRFRDLVSLDLANNTLSTIEEGAFEHLTKLEHLDMQGNQLLLNGSTFKPLVFAGLKNLKSLKLNNNSVRSDCQLPSEAFAHLPALQSLDLDGLTNMTFGSPFSGLTDLVNIRISGRRGNCDMRYLLNHTFQFVRNVTYLEVTRCTLFAIEPYAFSPLRNLRFLDISHNRELGFKKFGIGSFGLRGTPLEVLKLNFIHNRYAPCVKVNKAHLQHLHYTSLREIYLDGNRLEVFEEGALLLLPPTLTKVSAQYNSFTMGPYIQDLPQLKNLKSINIGDKGLNFKLPVLMARGEEATSYFMDLHDLQFVDLAGKTVSGMLMSRAFQGSGTSTTTSEETPGGGSELMTLPPEQTGPQGHIIIRYPVPPNITEIKLKWLKLFYHLDEFGFTENKLKYLDLSYNIFSVWKGPVHGVETVEELDLSSNFAHVVNVTFFQNFKSLKKLYIHNNFMYDVFRKKYDGHDVGDIFSHLSTLEELYVSRSHISGIREDMMRGLTSLRVFDLAENPLHADYLNVNISYAQNLTFINFTYCSLSTLPKTLRYQLDSLANTTKNISIDISSNPFACDCWNLGFLHWLSTTPVKLRRPERIYCIFPGSHYRGLSNITEVIKDVEALCLNSEMATLVAGLSVGIFIFLVVIAGCVVFRLRWKLYYLYYVARNQSSGLEDDQELLLQQQRGFLYDAFIAFDLEDRAFVQDELRARLEEQQGLRLCLHYRDLPLGRFTLQSVVEAIHSSRRTVCLLTQHFLESRECRFFFEMARMESLHENRDVVLFVLKDHVVSRALPRDILYYIKSESYVEYPRDRRCLAFFWDNLIKALRNPVHSSEYQTIL